MSQKIHANWNLAATHYLTAAFATSIFKAILGGILIALLLKGASITSALSIIVSFVAAIITVWIGVWVSAKWMNKKYIISDKDKVVNFAVIYSVVMFALYSFILLPFKESIFVKLLRLFTIAEVHTFQGTDLFIQIIQSILVVVLFFIFSKKYLKNSQQPLQ